MEIEDYGHWFNLISGPNINNFYYIEESYNLFNIISLNECGYFIIDFIKSGNLVSSFYKFDDNNFTINSSNGLLISFLVSLKRLFLFRKNIYQLGSISVKNMQVEEYGEWTDFSTLEHILQFNKASCSYLKGHKDLSMEKDVFSFNWFLNGEIVFRASRYNPNYEWLISFPTGPRGIREKWNALQKNQ